MKLLIEDVKAALAAAERNKHGGFTPTECLTKLRQSLEIAVEGAEERLAVDEEFASRVAEELERMEEAGELESQQTPEEPVEEETTPE